MLRVLRTQVHVKLWFRQRVPSVIRLLNYYSLLSSSGFRILACDITSSPRKNHFDSKMLGLEREMKIFRHIPGHGLAWSDPRLENQPSLSEPDVDHTILDYLDDLGEGYLEYAVPDKVLEKWGRLFDIVKPSTDRTCCFTRGYTQLVERAGSILQENEDLDTTAVFNKFLEAQAREDADAVKIVHPLRLRYFSPSELLRLFAFDPPRRESTFVWPDSTSKKSKYKLIGNSINVKVVQTLIEYLFKEPE